MKTLSALIIAGKARRRPLKSGQIGLLTDRPDVGTAAVRAANRICFLVRHRRPSRKKLAQLADNAKGVLRQERAQLCAEKAVTGETRSPVTASFFVRHAAHDFENVLGRPPEADDSIKAAT